MLDAAGAAADEDEPICVEQHHADAGAIGQVFVARHSVTTPYDQTGTPWATEIVPNGVSLARF